MAEMISLSNYSVIGGLIFSIFLALLFVLSLTIPFGAQLLKIKMKNDPPPVKLTSEDIGKLFEGEYETIEDFQLKVANYRANRHFLITSGTLESSKPTIDRALKPYHVMANTANIFPKNTHSFDTQLQLLGQNTNFAEPLTSSQNFEIKSSSKNKLDGSIFEKFELQNFFPFSEQPLDLTFDTGVAYAMPNLSTNFQYVGEANEKSSENLSTPTQESHLSPYQNSKPIASGGPLSFRFFAKEATPSIGTYFYPIISGATNIDNTLSNYPVLPTPYTSSYHPRQSPHFTTLEQERPSQIFVNNSLSWEEVSREDGRFSNISSVGPNKNSHLSFFPKEEDTTLQNKEFFDFTRKSNQNFLMKVVQPSDKVAQIDLSKKIVQKLLTDESEKETKKSFSHFDQKVSSTSSRSPLSSKLPKIRAKSPSSKVFFNDTFSQKSDITSQPKQTHISEIPNNLMIPHPDPITQKIPTPSSPNFKIFKTQDYQSDKSSQDVSKFDYKLTGKLPKNVQFVPSTSSTISTPSNVSHQIIEQKTSQKSIQNLLYPQNLSSNVQDQPISNIQPNQLIFPPQVFPTNNPFQNDQLIHSPQLLHESPSDNQFVQPFENIHSFQVIPSSQYFTPCLDFQQNQTIRSPQIPSQKSDPKIPFVPESTTPSVNIIPSSIPSNPSNESQSTQNPSQPNRNFDNLQNQKAIFPPQASSSKKSPSKDKKKKKKGESLEGPQPYSTPVSPFLSYNLSPSPSLSQSPLKPSNSLQSFSKKSTDPSSEVKNQNVIYNADYLYTFETNSPFQRQYNIYSNQEANDNDPHQLTPKSNTQPSLFVISTPEKRKNLVESPEKNEGFFSSIGKKIGGSLSPKASPRKKGTPNQDVMSLLGSIDKKVMSRVLRD